MTHRVPEIPAETIVDVVEALWVLGQRYDLEGISAYTGETEERVERGFEGATQLEFVKETDNQTEPLRPCIPQARLLARAHTRDKPIVFKMQLAEYPPFRFFLECVESGFDSIQSATRTRVKFGIDATQNIIKHTLTEWGLYAGIFIRKDGKLRVNLDEKQVLSRYLDVMNAILDDEAEARSLLRRRITDDCYDSLEDRVRTDLVSVFVKAAHDEADKRQIVFPLGTAFEGFLCQIASSHTPAVDLSDCSGIGQMANRLRSNGVLASKHTAMTSYVAAARNAADHDSDPEEGKPWNFTNESVLDIAMVTVNTMRSIHEYCFKGKELIF